MGIVAHHYCLSCNRLSTQKEIPLCAIDTTHFFSRYKKCKVWTEDDEHCGKKTNNFMDAIITMSPSIGVEERR
jgi:hypothetical protein